MTRADSWKRRKCVLRYRDLADRIRAVAGEFKFPEANCHVKYFLPMPKSWSRAKKEQHEGKPCRTRPDVDNLHKALLDSLCKEDSYIWDTSQEKRFSEVPRIEILWGDDYLEWMLERVRNLSEP